MNHKINNVPGFAADASIYKTNGHYQTSRQAIDSPEQMISLLYLAMVNQDGVNCGNCVGGDCAELHCFEDWAHGGGASGGPYQGGGGGGGSGTGAGGKCSWNVPCTFDCNDKVFYPCYARCLDNAGGNFGTSAFKSCKGQCNTLSRQCYAGCKTCH
jgi:hypothetical protein